MSKHLASTFFTLLTLLTGSVGEAFAQEETTTSSSDVTVNDTPAQSTALVTPEQWLEKMGNALSTLNFEASFVVLRPGLDSEPYLWRHGVMDDGTQVEQLNLLNGPGREAVRVGSKVSYFEPNVQPYTLASDTINGPLPDEFLANPMGMIDAYELVLVGKSRVSGRAAQQIRVVSKDRSRFGFNLWLDQDSGLILKLDMLDLKGQLLEQIQVTELDITDKPNPFFDRLMAASLPEKIDIAPVPDRPKRWAVGYLPEGMKEVKRDIHRLPITGNVVEYMLFSDGLVDVSVYLQNSDEVASDQDILVRHEANTLLIRKVDNLQVTVVGKVPPQTAVEIAASLHILEQP